MRVTRETVRRRNTELKHLSKDDNFSKENRKIEAIAWNSHTIESTSEDGAPADCADETEQDFSRHKMRSDKSKKLATNRGNTENIEFSIGDG
jgi:hypothetical protein